MSFEEFLYNFLSSSLRLSVPLVLASLGGYFSEKSGVINIGLEGKMLFSAFAAAAGSILTGSPWLGLGIGILASILFAMLFGYLTVYARANQIIAGTSLQLLALGLASFLGKILFGMTNSTPSLDDHLKISSIWGVSPLLIAALVLIFITYIIDRFTVFGNHLHFAGENPATLEVRGISSQVVRMKALLGTGVLCGIAGSYLSIDHGNSYVRNMTSGRGFIAVAALIMGRWKPLRTACFALVFAMIEASSFLWNGFEIPSQWTQMLPFAMTLIVLALSQYKRSSAKNAASGFAPKTLGQN